MSKRNSLESKRLRKRLRTLTKGTLPRYIDLVEWLKLRENLTTTECHRLILAGCLRVDSHKVGIRRTPFGDRVQQLVPADLASQIQIVMPDPEVLVDA